eukprot:Nitzschia sp. Nitz4//scaffold33_size148984//73547//74308//NITZ4_002928-RA/size148984-processed-gene-0.166-mRNA-1//-1//CDS//3329548427//160//frame0
MMRPEPVLPSSSFDAVNSQTESPLDSNANVHPTRRAIATFLSKIETIKTPSFLRAQGSLRNPSLITGLDRVVLGTQPACEVVTVAGFHPPRYLCYMLSGFVCDLIQLCFDILLHVVLAIEDASLCWMLGFAISVYFRHTTHRYLVFGDYVGGYWQSLGRMYAGYSLTIVLSTAFNWFLFRYAQVPHYVAWVITLLWTGIVNYFILKKLWSFGGKQKNEDIRTGVPTSPVEKRDVELGGRMDGKLQSRAVDGKR